MLQCHLAKKVLSNQVPIKIYSPPSWEKRRGLGGEGDSLTKMPNLREPAFRRKTITDDGLGAFAMVCAVKIF